MSVLARHPFMIGPEGRLRAVKDPTVGYGPVPDLAVSVHRLLSGAARTDRPARSPRLFSAQWPFLSDVERAWLELCAYGRVPAPLVWADPLVANQLPPWVQSPTGALRDVSATSGALAASGAGSQGWGALVWSAPSTNAVLTLGPWVPVLPGVAFTGSVWALRGSAAVSGIVQIGYRDAAGGPLATNSGPTVVLTTTAQRLSYVGTAPAGAVSAQLRLKVTTSGSPTVTVDAPQVEWGPLSAFAPGPGLAYVTPLSYAPSVYMAGRTSVQMSLQEVG